ncbi:AAA family ATPase [Magnetospirillum aberrantis]|uniref:AAA family ATPase n=1 Tax=Magnetospirillum aberrantis SpK TaxID=908842 RepID=A0A7C9UZB0_9PROT|nr:AAA family ATPase [Magnetospirillum aberrantis]NFV82110.1 AAA family ATPase [Magnetospirillum aberrantis SpK]
MNRIASEKAKAPVGTGAFNLGHEFGLPRVETECSSHCGELRAPSALRDLSAWLIWRYEPGDKKPRKVPYYVTGGRRKGTQGGAEDRAHLVTFDAATDAAKRRQFDGVGFATLPEFNVVALDFDRCVVDGTVHQDVEKLVAGTYAEYSPSGNGVRAFMRGNLGNGKDTKGEFGFEVFSDSGFVTFTGKTLPVTEMLGTADTIADVTTEVQALAAKRFNRVPSSASTADPLLTYEPCLGLTPDQIKAALAVLDPDMGYGDWLNVGMALHHETDGEGFDFWNDWSAGGSKYPGADPLQQKWGSFGGQGGRPVTARYLVKLAKEHGVGLNVFSLDEFTPPTMDARNDGGRFHVVPAGEFSRGRAPDWIIKGVVPRAELVVLFGESGSGKSFLALDMAAAIARGADWWGNRTKPGRVVYIAAEGGGGFRNRLRAYEQARGVSLDSLPLGIIHAAPNFLQKDDALDVARAIGSADVVFVDTFAQVTPGANENAAEDIGKALTHCRGIHRATGAVVVLIHHAGKDPTRGARGWSGLKAAADAEIEVLRLPNGRIARISKQKDGEDGLEWGFDLVKVPIGMDDDGDVVDSCVVERADTVPAACGRQRPLGIWQRLALEILNEFAIGQTEGIEPSAVVAEMLVRGPVAEEGKRDARKQRADRALRAVCEGDDAPYRLDGDYIKVAE